MPLGTIERHVLLGSVGRSFLRPSKHTAGGTGLPTLTLFTSSHNSLQVRRKEENEMNEETRTEKEEQSKRKRKK